MVFIRGTFPILDGHVRQPMAHLFRLLSIPLNTGEVCDRLTYCIEVKSDLSFKRLFILSIAE